MKLELKNIGKFKEAEVLLEGITVIGGENNTGKSTISKTLFSVIKAYQEAEEYKYIEEKEFKHLLMELDRILWFLVRYRFSKGNYKNISKLIDKLNNELRPLRYGDEINISILQKIASLLRNLVREFNNIIQEIENDKDKIKVKRFKTYLANLKEIEKELKDVISKKDTGNLENSLNFQIRKNFRGQISNINSKNISKIELINDNNKTIFDIEIKNNKCIKFKEVNEPKFKEISYIETPLVLNKIRLFDSLKYLSPRLQRKIYIPYIEEDIVKKLRIQVNIDNIPINFIEKIEKIIGGSFEVEDEDIVFIEGNKRFYPINVASGIKSFGIIYLLIKNGWLYDDTHILIFDEPEVHLHPKWQIRYAELLVKLHKAFNCKILINSHSPDFIQAIRYFGNKYKVIEKIHFYFAEAKNEMATLELIDNKLSKIFKSLIEPADEMEDLLY